MTSTRAIPQFDTADFCDTPVAPPCSGPGNLRADYVLPRKNLQIVGAGVFWPDGDDPLLYLTGTGSRCRAQTTEPCGWISRCHG